MIETDTTVIETVYIIEPYLTTFSQENLNEIIALVESAGAVYYGYKTQYVREITPATYIGKGKLQEIKAEIDNSPVNLIVFDGELSPSQTLNIAEALGVKVIDRTTLILDIFALNATTSEGKVQVELAQLKYMYPRLKGKGIGLSQQGAGIGTRGPGETQLETDRRHIRQRINFLEKELEELTKRRKIQRERRKKNAVKTVALVGYTNTGKSTLLNLLTGSDVLTKNQLFATLDPTIRKMQLDDVEICVIDTVGFVKNIPHNLIEAFKSTLETAIDADLVLNVCDATGDFKTQIETTTQTLKELDENVKSVLVVNKCENLSDFSQFPSDAICISALTGYNVEKLKSFINDYFKNTYKELTFIIPYKNLNSFMKFQTQIKIKSLEYLDNGALITATIPDTLYSKIKCLKE